MTTLRKEVSEYKLYEAYEFLGLDVGYYENTSKRKKETRIITNELPKRVEEEIEYINSQVLRNGVEWHYSDGSVEKQDIKKKGNWVITFVLGRANPFAGAVFGLRRVIESSNIIKRNLGIEFNEPYHSVSIFDKDSSSTESFIYRY